MLGLPESANSPPDARLLATMVELNANSHLQLLPLHEKKTRLSVDPKEVGNPKGDGELQPLDQRGP